jgi:hypothetical protein
MPFRGKPPSVDPTSGYIGIQTHTGRVAFGTLHFTKGWQESLSAPIQRGQPLASCSTLSASRSAA